MLGHIVVLFLIFLKNYHNAFHNHCTIYNPTNSTHGFQFLHTTVKNDVWFQDEQCWQTSTWHTEVSKQRSLMLELCSVNNVCSFHLFSPLILEASWRKEKSDLFTLQCLPHRRCVSVFSPSLSPFFLLSFHWQIQYIINKGKDINHIISLHF